MNRLDTIELGGIVTIRDELLRQQAEGKKIYRLESGTPSFNVNNFIKDSIIKSLEENQTTYTAGSGITSLRKCILEKVQKKNKLPIESHEQIYITNGAMNGLYCVLYAIIEKDDDEIIMPDPTWTETADIVTSHGVIPIRVSTEKDNFRFIADKIEEYINKDTIAIIVNSPHNPTGIVSTYKELEEIVEIAEHYGIWIISDEAYEDIIFNKEHVSIGSFNYPKTISIYSFSKSYAMSGLRLGYVVLNQPNEIVEERIQKLLRMTINGVNSITQWGGVEAIKTPSTTIKIMTNEYEERRDITYDEIKRLKILTPIYPDGAFYLWCKVNECDESKYQSQYQYLGDWLSDKLLKVGVGCIPGRVFGPASCDYVRFSFACDGVQLCKALRIIYETLKIYN